MARHTTTGKRVRWDVRCRSIALRYRSSRPLPSSLTGWYARESRLPQAARASHIRTRFFAATLSTIVCLRARRSLRVSPATLRRQLRAVPSSQSCSPGRRGNARREENPRRERAFTRALRERQARSILAAAELGRDVRVRGLEPAVACVQCCDERCTKEQALGEVLACVDARLANVKRVLRRCRL
jgi:hypothetical protein